MHLPLTHVLHFSPCRVCSTTATAARTSSPRSSAWCATPTCPSSSSSSTSRFEHSVDFQFLPENISLRLLHCDEGCAHRVELGTRGIDACLPGSTLPKGWLACLGIRSLQPALAPNGVTFSQVCHKTGAQIRLESHICLWTCTLTAGHAEHMHAGGGAVSRAHQRRRRLAAATVRPAGAAVHEVLHSGAREEVTHAGGRQGGASGAAAAAAGAGRPPTASRAVCRDALPFAEKL